MSGKKQKISILKRLEFRYYQLMAKIGDKSSQCSLGCCYVNGLGTEEDNEKAFYWFTKAANRGEVTAQNNLGVCYDNGFGTEENPAEAMAWYKKAAERN